ncbi:MAG: oligosaccharide repeat unit polymerase [Leptospiraceae bacterium]|nr:oligosaccharide repeat unit polymerase [Leptospiraceae bacterium]
MSKKSFIFDILLFLIIIIILIFQFLLIHEFHNWGGDFSYYISQSISLKNMNFDLLSKCSDIRLLRSEHQVGPNYYPWMFPILLLPGQFLSNNLIYSLKICNFLYSFLFYISIYLLFFKKISKLNLFLIISFFASSSFITEFNQNILSDIISASLNLFCLYLITLLEKCRKIKIFISLILTVFLSASINTRTASIILYILIFFVLINSIKNKNIKSVLNLSFSVLISLLLNHIFDNLFLKSDYSQNHNLLSDSINTIKVNLPYYYEIIKSFYTGDHIISNFLFVIGILLFLYGVIDNFKKEYIFIIYFILTLSLYLVYPPLQGLRFIISILPFFMYFIIKSLNKLNFKYKYIFNGLIFLFLTFNIAINILNIFNKFFIKENYFEGVYSNSVYSQLTYDFINKNTQKEDIIIFYKPRVLTFFTDRCSIMVTSKKYLMNSSAKYFVYYKYFDYPTETLEFLKSKKNVYKNEHFSIFKI